MALDIIKHKNILIKILKDIYTDSTIGPLLGFKGGTAAYLFYNLSRFSVDLDFDLLERGKESEVFDKVERIITDYGKVKEKYNKKNTLIFILSYFEEAHNIKIEINKRNFGSEYELKNYLGISILTMIKKDMFAHKLVAMLERNKMANRDMFDVWFFLKKDWEINKEIVEKRTGLKFKDYLSKSLKFAENLKERNILAGMGELLEEKIKLWAKDNLKDDLIFLLKLRLESE